MEKKGKQYENRGQHAPLGLIPKYDQLSTMFSTEFYTGLSTKKSDFSRLFLSCADIHRAYYDYN